MKHYSLFAALLVLMLTGCTNTNEQTTNDDRPIVYMTKDISPEGLVRIYEALGIRILEQAEKIGLGSRHYELVSIDK